MDEKVDVGIHSTELQFGENACLIFRREKVFLQFIFSSGGTI